MDSNNTFFSRRLDEGMGVAVAKRTYLRKDESWADVAMRVADGNCSLVPTTKEEQFELTKAIAKASVLPAGRHLQHGDHTQKDRNIEVFSNCSTACSSFIKFYLLLNGSGVGRMYNDDLMLIDWRHMPDVTLTLDPKHHDFRDFIRLIYGTRIQQVLNQANLLEKYPNFNDVHYDIGFELYSEELKNINPYTPEYTQYTLADSREGWAKGLEYLEVMSFEKKSRHNLVLDFSEVRESGTPIKGMQNRPASGPAYTAYAFWKISRIKNNTFSYFDYTLNREVERVIAPEPWKQCIFIDHYASECVANGGARRSARISVKYWKDENIKDFINLKHDYVNYEGESVLWSSNNSVGVDKEFWMDAKNPGTRAFEVYQMITEASYGHGTGEPGIVNLDKLTSNEEGI